PRRYASSTLFPYTTLFRSTLEELPGLTEGPGKRAVSLWDVQSDQSRQLLDGNAIGTFSPDGRTLALTATDEDYYATALKLFDTADRKSTRLNSSHQIISYA